MKFISKNIVKSSKSTVNINSMSRFVELFTHLRLITQNISAVIKKPLIVNYVNKNRM